jgi:hypothetical protein
MPFTLPIWFTPLVQASAVAYAVWNGDIEERLVGWETAVILALDTYFLKQRAGIQSIEFLSITVDLGVALAVALRSNKTWPLAYSAAVLATLLTLIAQMIDPVSRWAYVTVQFVWIYLECLILVIGARRARRARRAVVTQGTGGGSIVNVAG